MIIEILSKIFDVIINKIALPIAVLCALLLFIPKSILRVIEVLTIVDSYRGVIWIVFLFSILVYSYEKGKTLFAYIKIKFDKRTYLKQVISNLDGLSPQEQAWIYYCLKNNNRTLIATAANETAVSLENKGLVYRPTGNYSILDTPYTLHTIVWDYLKKNKEIFCPQEKLNDQTYNREVTKFIRNLRSAI